MFKGGLITYQNNPKQPKKTYFKSKINKTTNPFRIYRKLELSCYSFICSYFCVRCPGAVAGQLHSFVRNGQELLGNLWLSAVPAGSQAGCSRASLVLPGVFVHLCDSKWWILKKTHILGSYLKCGCLSGCHISCSVFPQILQPSKYSNANANKKPWGLQ